MSDVLDELRAQLHDLGAEAPEADSVLRDLVGLRELADAPPAPSAELAALLGRGPAPSSGAPRRPRSSGAWARRGGTVGGAVVVLVSSLGATGLSAAANTLPEPLQERVAGFSRAYLPFEFPSVADRREHDPFAAGRHRAERPRADRRLPSPAPDPLLPVRPATGSEASRQEVPASRSAARPEPTRGQSVSFSPAGGASDQTQGDRPRSRGPDHPAGHAAGHAAGHGHGPEKPRAHPSKPTKPRSAGPDGPAAVPVAAPVVLPVKAPVKAPAAAPPAGEPVIGQPVDEAPVVPTRPRQPQRPTLGPPPVVDGPDQPAPGEVGPEHPATEEPVTEAPVTEEPAAKPSEHAWDGPESSAGPATGPAVGPAVEPGPAVADEVAGG